MARKSSSKAKKTGVRRSVRLPVRSSVAKPAETKLAFPIAAVGASAGGLAALTALLKALPANSGMAFVLIQHLEPKHESALASLLSRATKMAVVEITHGMVVQPNRVYVIPPNKSVSLKKGALRLTPRSKVTGLHRPIDDFAKALAAEQGNAAIGVILSGTGSDGTGGLKAIKAAGGITFAQDPKSAQWPDMPKSAIAAGVVDFALPPKDIAAELTRIARHPYLIDTREVAEELSDLEQISVILLSSTGVDLRLYKPATVRRRIARRMAVQKVVSLDKYALILKQNLAEVQALADDLFVHVTSFFRDPACFEALRKRVLAKICKGRSAKEPIRVWVAGCSTGEEAYSLAMLLREELGENSKRIRVQIFGTDIQERSVETARLGIYSEAALAGVSPARLKRFFVKSGHGYQVNRALRATCIFARHDLAKDPPFSKLDVVSCRNVLIYMGAALQKGVLAAFQYALKPGGVLFLGTSESIADSSSAFTTEDRQHKIFLRKPSAAGFSGFGRTANSLRPPIAALPLASSVPSGAVDLRKVAEAALLHHYAPPALVVDADLHIIHFQGDTSPYVTPAPGQPSFHLLKMVRPEFVVDLRTAINKAKRSRAPVGVETRHLDRQEQPAITRLEVRTLGTGQDEKRDLLVVFQKLQSAPPLPAPDATDGPQGTRAHAASVRVTRLELDLASTREQMRVLITENDAAQEEMRAANEEILSSNEELQSTNEELETAKEELQSSNEELITLNEELQHRNAELSVLTQDLNSLLLGLDLPVLVLDAELRVRRFTPVAGSLLNLIAGDVGRPFRHIASNLAGADWEELFSEVTGRGRSVERNVTDGIGRRYSLRLRPYKATGTEIAGVLVVLFDIDAFQGALEEAREARDLALEAEQHSLAILNSLPAQVTVIGAHGTIVATNDAWNRFAVENEVRDLRAVGQGANYLEVCRKAAAKGVDEGQAVLEGIRRVLNGTQAFFQLEYSCHSPVHQRWFLMTVSPLLGHKGGAVVSHTDITGHKLAELSMQRTEASIRSLLESSPQAVIGVNRQEIITLVNGNSEKLFGYAPQELIGQPLSLLVPEAYRERHAKHHQTYFAKMESRPMGIGLNLEARRKDGTTFPVEIGLSSIDTAAGKVSVAFVSDITHRRELEHAAETDRRKVRALAASLLTAQEEERRRVSRELHDQICQQLASLAMDVGALAAQPDPLQNTQKSLKELQSRIVKASEETRHIAYQMHPSVLDDLGLVASLRSLCREFSEREGVAVEFDSGDLPDAVPRAVASCVYRVAQESLQNIAKHSASKHATVTIGLALQRRAIALSIEDTGVGFDLEEAKGHGGLGLVSMEERVRLVNGTLSIASRKGHGTRIALSVPLTSAKP